VGTDLALELGALDVGDVQRVLVGLLDVGADELDGLGDVLGVGAVLGGVAGPDQGEDGDAGVADVGRVLDLRPLDAAAALAADAPWRAAACPGSPAPS